MTIVNPDWITCTVVLYTAGQQVLNKRYAVFTATLETRLDQLVSSLGADHGFIIETSPIFAMSVPLGTDYYEL